VFLAAKRCGHSVTIAERCSCALIHVSLDWVAMPTNTATRPRRPAGAPWWAAEFAIALSDAPAHLPPRAGGRRVSRATVARWARIGCHGLRLRTFAGGARGQWTTIEELARFLAVLSSIRGLT
jgi:hypothetical protein